MPNNEIIPIQPPKRLMRARGKARREKLLDAASELLSGHTSEELTYKDIYRHAGVPPGSAYHFFDNIEDVFDGLLERFSLELYDLLVEPFQSEEIPNWMTLANKLVERGVDYYDRNPAARQTLMQPKQPQGRVSEADTRSGVAVQEIFNRYFILPEMNNPTRVFTFFTKFVNLIFSVSVTQHGTITEEMCEEAQTAGNGYLKMHLPEKLMKKVPSEEFSGSEDPQATPQAQAE